MCPSLQILDLVYGVNVNMAIYIVKIIINIEMCIHDRILVVSKIYTVTETCKQDMHLTFLFLESHYYYELSGYMRLKVILLE